MIVNTGPSPPCDVQGFCSVVVWRIPHEANGKIIGYDLELIHQEAIILAESDEPFLEIAKIYQLIGATVQVLTQRCRVYEGGTHNIKISSKLTSMHDYYWKWESVIVFTQLSQR